MTDLGPRLAPRLLAAPEAGPGVLDTLCEAFADYPVMRYVIGTGGDYGGRLRTLIGFFLTARVLRGDPVFGVFSGTELAGVALCTLPGAAPPPPALDEFRDRTWAALGTEARARYDECVRAWEPLAVSEPNLHLNMLGVPPRLQGRGIGRVLLERVHALSLELPDSRGVTLTTETVANVALYRRFGYRLVRHRQIAPGLESWGFFRPD